MSLLPVSARGMLWWSLALNLFHLFGAHLSLGISNCILWSVYVGLCLMHLSWSLVCVFPPVTMPTPDAIFFLKFKSCGLQEWSPKCFFFFFFKLVSSLVSSKCSQKVNAPNKYVTDEWGFQRLCFSFCLLCLNLLSYHSHYVWILKSENATFHLLCHFFLPLFSFSKFLGSFTQEELLLCFVCGVMLMLVLFWLFPLHDSFH